MIGEEPVLPKLFQSHPETKYDTQTQVVLCNTRKRKEKTAKSAKHRKRCSKVIGGSRKCSPLDPILDLECAKDVCVVRISNQSKK